MRVRVLFDGPACGAVNMARDLELWEEVENGAAEAVIRVYGWVPPALSLGCHQVLDAVDHDLARKLGIEVVRRPTGGGAILHDDELTYCWAVPKRAFADPSVEAVLSWSAGVLRQFYHRLGLEARPAHEERPAPALGQRTTVCYAGLERWDLTVGGQKIGGNAQRRGRRAILQHGSIPLTLDWERVLALTRSPPSEPPACLRSLGIQDERGELLGLLARVWEEAFACLEVG